MDFVIIKFILLIYGGFIIISVDAANILAIFPNVWKSHYIFGRSILTELATEGHNITLVSAYSGRPLENSTEIQIGQIEQNWIEMGLSYGIDELRSTSVMERLTKMIDVGTSNADLILNSKDIKNLLNYGPKFDLLFVDLLLSEALLGLAYYFKVPTVIISATGSNKLLPEMTGNPHNSAFDPNSLLPFVEEMNLSQRIVNTLMTIFEKLTYNFFHMLCQESVYKRHFRNLIQTEDLPPLNSLVRKVNLVLLNSHPIIQYPKAYLPNVIEIGGAHIRSKGTLPQKILRFIEDSSEEVVYISFGANLRTFDLPREKFDALMTALNSLRGKLRVILKWEVPGLEDSPPNVMLGDWFPQQDILAHEKVKLFITSGGLLSVMESIHWKTPMIGIPILPEQEVNIQRVERLNCGIKLSYDNFTAETLLWSIKTILSDPIYEASIKMISSLFQENLNDPRQKSVYYVNLVLRTNGSTYLQSTATKLGFFKTELIDVLAIIFLGIFAILAVPSIVICLILRKANSCKPEWIDNPEDRKKQL